MAEGSEGAAIDTNSSEFKEAAETWLKDQGIHKALESEREARKEAERKARDYDGIDLEEYRKIMAERDKAEEERQREAGNFEELRKKDQEKFTAAIGERDAKIDTLTKSLEAALIESAATSAISSHGGDAELLLPHVTKATRLVEQDGRHIAVVVDGRGEPMLAPDAKTATDYMTIEHLVSGWREDGKYPGAFAGTGASGGGASPSRNGGSSAGTPKTVSASDPSALMKYEKEIASGEVRVAFD